MRRETVLCLNKNIKVVALLTVLKTLATCRASKIGTGRWTVGLRIPVSGKRFFSSPKRPEQLSKPPSLLLNGYCNSFPGVKLTTNEWSYTYIFLRLQGVDRDFLPVFLHACLVAGIAQSV